AERCGISTAAVHYHFAGRQEMLEDALRVSVHQAYDRQAAELETIDDPLQRLLRLIALQLPSPGLLRQEWSIWLQVWAQSALDPTMGALDNAAYSRWHATVRRVIEYGQQRGAFVTGDSGRIARRLTALIDGLGIQVIAGSPDYTVDDMRSTLHD